MPESLLTILKLLLLALLYLFFFRVVRAVWAGLRAEDATTAPAAPAPTAARPAAPVAKSAGSGVRRDARTPKALRAVEPAADAGRRWDLGDDITLGRGPQCTIQLPDVLVSHLHARIYRQDNRVLIEDLGSTNGTFVNRKRVSGAQPLRTGDRVQLGPHVLEVVA